MNARLNGTPLIPVFVKATAIVDLLSQFERPFRFQVTVSGDEFPYSNERRIYEIVAKTDALAAQEGIKRFVDAMKLQYQRRRGLL